MTESETLNLALGNPGIKARCVVLDDVPGDASVHIQIIDLGRQMYIWISSAGQNLSDLHMAIQSHTEAQPTVATILPASATSQSASLAKRIGMLSCE